MALKGVKGLEGCIFCRIVAKEVSSDIVYEDEEVVAFRDINPQAPVHVLIVPRKHLSTLNDATSDDQLLLGKLLLVARQLAHQLQVADDGYRLVLNVNRGAGQSIYHIHMHLLGGRVFHWPPG